MLNSNRQMRTGNLGVVRNSIWTYPVFFFLYAGFCSAKLLVAVSTPSVQNYQLLLGLNIVEALCWLCWICNRHGFVMGPIMVMLPLISVVYTNVPIALLAVDLAIFPFPEDAVYRAMILQSLLVSQLWASLGLAFTKAGGAELRYRIKNWLDSLLVTRTGILGFLSLGALIVLLYLLNFYFSGAWALLGSGNRIELFSQVETGKIWLLQLAFTAWLMVAVLVWNSQRARKEINRLHCVSAALLIVMFAVPYLRIGNRREFASVLLLITILLLLSGNIRRVVFMVSAVVPVLIYLGAARTADLSSADPVSFYLNTVGEFVFPHFPLIDHIASGHDLWLGWSYLRLPAHALPSIGLWDKAQTLALLFSQDYSNGAMGYAYTPLGECYANFGVVAVVVLPVALTLVLKFVTSKWLNVPLAALVLLSLSLDINRGEFVSMAVELLLFTLAIWLYLRLLRLRIHLLPDHIYARQAGRTS